MGIDLNIYKTVECGAGRDWLSGKLRKSLQNKTTTVMTKLLQQLIFLVVGVNYTSLLLLQKLKGDKEGDADAVMHHTPSN